jgi:hypothetical protein
MHDVLCYENDIMHDDMCNENDIMPNVLCYENDIMHNAMCHENDVQAARETRKIYQDHYFLADPDKFIFEFFPMAAEHQFLEHPITRYLSTAGANVYTECTATVLVYTVCTAGVIIPT